MKNKKGVLSVGGILVIILVIAAIVGAGLYFLPQQVLDDDDDGIQTNVGESATLYLELYTGSWGNAGAKTEVAGTYTVLDQNGVALINDQAVNSTTSVSVGDIVDIYGTGATYYQTAETGVKIDTASKVTDLEGYRVCATTDLVITAYDVNEDALTADDHSNNTADYAGGDVAASDNEVYYIKLEQTGADDTFDLGGICTWFIGAEADDFELVESDWTEVNVPDTLASTSVTMLDDDGTNTSERGFAHCYTPTNVNYIRLLENQDTGKLKFVFDSDDTTQPSANGDTFFGVAFLDASWSVDKNGNIEYGFYMDDDTEDPASVGLDESADGTFNGLDIAVAIEPQ